MKKKLLITVLLVALTPINALANVQFTDIKPTDWYYQEIRTAVNNEYVKGYTDNEFKPKKLITWAEYITMLNKVTHNPVNNSKNKKHWAEDEIKATIKKGYIDPNNYKIDVKIKRQEVAEILYKALELQGTNQGNKRFIDTDSIEITTLYNMGIISGEETIRGVKFRPNDRINRAEVVTILNKVIKYRESKVLVKLYPTEFKLQPIKEEPETIEDFNNLYLNMAQNKEYYKEIYYKNTPYFTLENKKIKEIALQSFEEISSKYPDKFPIVNKANVKITEKDKTSIVILELQSNGIDQVKLNKYLEDYTIAIRNVVEELINTNVVTAEMNQKEIAKAVYRWLINNIAYDKRESPESYTGYGAINNRLAVCQGYVIAYNHILRVFGIETEGQPGGIKQKGKYIPHIWTKANLDGRKTNIDATFGDTDIGKDQADMKYFDITDQELAKTHIWK